jgi:hypothetical protein
MANNKGQNQTGTKPCDLINLGVITRTFPRAIIDRVLQETDTASERKRDLPAHVVIYYVIAMTIYMGQSYREILRILLEGLRSILGMGSDVHVAGKSGISQARTRLGEEPIRKLHDEIVKPIAVKSEQQCTRGAWYHLWRVMSLDGSTLDVADTPENEAAFGRSTGSRGHTAFPQIRFVSLVESGTHVMCASRMGAYKEDEISLARQALPQMKKGMLCLTDRYFFSYNLWNEASATGADLLWRVKKSMQLPCHKRLPDGSYLSKVYPYWYDRLRDRNGIVVRVIEYQLKGVPHAEPLYRLITTILDWSQAPAQELAALYHERWEVETSLDELKTHLRGANIVLRSKRPHLVRQEFYGLMMAHFAVRGLMHEAALRADVDADKLSFIHAVRVIQRKMVPFSAFSPSEAPCIA